MKQSHPEVGSEERIAVFEILKIPNREVQCMISRAASIYLSYVVMMFTGMIFAMTISDLISTGRVVKDDHPYVCSKAEPKCISVVRIL